MDIRSHPPRWETLCAETMVTFCRSPKLGLTGCIQRNAARIATSILLEELRFVGGSILKDIWAFCGVVLPALQCFDH